MNYHEKRRHKAKQKAVVTKKKVKTSPKKKSALITYAVFLRSTRNRQRVSTDQTITHFNKELALKLAASKNPNQWVSIAPA
jgi:hypothetical protein